MESTAGESADGKSDGGLVVLGEKREVENGNVEELVIRRKKMRNGGFESEKEMRRVAEIVLVLSAMGRMRGGKVEPTEAEKAMMAEAREKVVAMCEELAPKDIMPREAFGGVIEDLGLNRLKEQNRLGFRGPKLSIVDKMELAKRRMGESKVFAAQAASYPSQQLQTVATAAGDNRGTPHNAYTFPSEKPGRAPVSTTSFRPPTPAGHVPSTTSAPLPFQPQTREVRPMVPIGLANSNLGKDFSSAAPRVEGTQYRSDGRPNDPSFAPQLPVFSSANQQVVKPVASYFQPQSAPTANSITKTKPLDHRQIKPEGTASLSARQTIPQVAIVQTTKPLITQTASSTVPGMHHPVQSMHFVHTAPIFNNHLEISKIVQKLLYPKLPELPSWIPPSKDYMNKALTCQMCKSVINEVEGVLVCDACEKGFHLRCLQSLVQKGIPRGEWHCHRCLSISSGKPFPPKYGRVTRNTNTPKVLSNTAGVQSSSEKKVVTVDQKVNQPNVVINCNTDGKKSPHTGLAAESASESKLSHGNDVSLYCKKDDGHNFENCPNDAAGTNCAPRSAGSSNDMHGQLELKSESCHREESVTEVHSEFPAKPPIASTSDHPWGSNNHDDIDRAEERLVAETLSETLAKPPLVTIASDQQQGSSNPNGIEHKGVSNGDGVDTELRQQDDGNGLIVCMEKSDACETICCNPNSNVKQDDQNAPQENNGRAKVRMEGEPSGALEDRLHNVEWPGDIQWVGDGKKFYQSCSVDGVVYKVQDYALFHLGNNKLIPSKLEAMWEDAQTNSKWVMVNRCYFPADLPDSVGHPCAPESNEVYDSNHDMTLMAGLIEGPCEVLMAKKFGEEDDQGSQVNDRRRPVFQCKWFYDKVKGVFRPIPS